MQHRQQVLVLGLFLLSCSWPKSYWCAFLIMIFSHTLTMICSSAQLSQEQCCRPMRRKTNARLREMSGRDATTPSTPHFRFTQAPRSTMPRYLRISPSLERKRSKDLAEDRLKPSRAAFALTISERSGDQRRNAQVPTVRTPHPCSHPQRID